MAIHSLSLQSGISSNGLSILPILLSHMEWNSGRHSGLVAWQPLALQGAIDIAVVVALF